MKPVIVVSNVGKTFRRYRADRPATIQEFVAKGLRRMTSIDRFWGLKDVSFSIEPGKMVGIIGSNGSGKSTLLRLIGGVGKPDTGRIQVNGRIGALLNLAAGFHLDLTGRENAVLAGILNGLTKKEVLRQMDSIVWFAELEHAIDAPVRTFSTGMRMRLAFAVAVHTEPDILLIDEVLAVGDVRFQRKCLDRIAEFKAAGCAILLVSHVGKTVEELCDEAIWLNSGQLMAQGPTNEVVKQYAAHMAADAPPAPAPAEPPVLVRTSRGAEIEVDAQRFGSQELAIESVRVVDSSGHPIDEVQSGDPVRIELGYVAAATLVAPIFHVALVREDGVICVEVTTESSSLSLQEIRGSGRLVLCLDRLDLNGGRYLVNVACYAQDWAYAYDFRRSVTAVVVRATGSKDAVLSPPHHWETARATDPVVS